MTDELVIPGYTGPKSFNAVATVNLAIFCNGSKQSPFLESKRRIKNLIEI